MRRQLILEDGSTFVGEGFGFSGSKAGEVVFNTGMTGYQEMISDPSYYGQILVMTYPLIGNCGINRDDFESIKPSISGLIVREHCEFPSNFRHEIELSKYLNKHSVPGLEGVDTRRLTRTIRKHGTLRGKICDLDADISKVVFELKQPSHLMAVPSVTCSTPYSSPGRGRRVVVMDFGMKHGILRELNIRGCDVFVTPYNASDEEILSLNPDGLLLSNGPGDPKDISESVETIKGLIPSIPTLGICLGHQLIALACGADTTKMKFGHRGSNHPVLDIQQQKVKITSQNHGFAVPQESLRNTGLEISHIALNDQTIEGLTHGQFPLMSVQYHPEASPGPEDDNNVFDTFMNMIDSNQRRKASCA